MPTTQRTAPSERAAPPGLSPWYSCHISKPAVYRVEMYDRLLTVRQTGGHVLASKNPPKRSFINGQSRKSAHRLLKILAMISRADPCLFVTLTTHKNETDWQISKRQLNRYLSFLRSRWPGVCGVWRFAWQNRGAAHYHLLLWGIVASGEDSDPTTAALRDAWLRATGEQADSAAKRHAVDVVPVGDFRACGFYLALYQVDQGPTDSDARHSGRTWGIVGRPSLSLRPKFSAELNESQQLFVRRTLRRHRRSWRNVNRKKRRSGPGPLARCGGGFSAFLPVEDTTRLVAWTLENHEHQRVHLHLEPLSAQRGHDHATAASAVEF